MRPKLSLVVATVVVAVGLMGVARADVNFTATFEGGTCFADANSLEYQGITFTNAELLYSSLGCLNTGFPPHSGDGVAFDAGSPITLTLNEAEGTESGDGDTVSGYFTTNSDITMQAFNGGTMCDSMFFQGPNFVGSGGPPPNQFLSVHCSEITSVTIFSSTGPDSFTLDDLTYPLSDSSVPEPGTMILLGTGVLGVLKRKIG